MVRRPAESGFDGLRGVLVVPRAGWLVTAFKAREIAGPLVGRYGNNDLYLVSFFACEMILDDLSDQLLMIDGIHSTKTVGGDYANDAVMILQLDCGRGGEPLDKHLFQLPHERRSHSCHCIMPLSMNLCAESKNRDIHFVLYRTFRASHHFSLTYLAQGILARW